MDKDFSWDGIEAIPTNKNWLDSRSINDFIEEIKYHNIEGLKESISFFKEKGRLKAVYVIKINEKDVLIRSIAGPKTWVTYTFNGVDCAVWWYKIQLEYFKEFYKNYKYKNG